MAYSSAPARCVEIRSTGLVSVMQHFLRVSTNSVAITGPVTLGDILEILPFEDPIVVLELDGEAIWAALEASLETWPAQEGLVIYNDGRAPLY